MNIIVREISNPPKVAMLVSWSEFHRLPFLLTDIGHEQKGHCSLTSFSIVIQYFYSIYPSGN